MTTHERTKNVQLVWTFFVRWCTLESWYYDVKVAICGKFFIRAYKLRAYRWMETKL